MNFGRPRELAFLLIRIAAKELLKSFLTGQKEASKALF